VRGKLSWVEVLPFVADRFLQGSKVYQESTDSIHQLVHCASLNS
jgi:hypothetical protein